jgi:hypothetical protein
MPNHSTELLDRVVDLFFGREAPEAEAHRRGMRRVLAIERLQHVRQAALPRLTRRSR